MENCWKIVEILKKRKIMEIAAKLEEKRKTNKQSPQYNQSTWPNREDQLSKIHGMTTCVLSLCERVRRKPELWMSTSNWHADNSGVHSLTENVKPPHVLVKTAPVATVIVDGNTRATVATEQGDVLTTVLNSAKIPRNTTKKRQFDVQNWPTEGPMFQKSFSKDGFRVHVIRTLSFFLRKKW